ncbi:MAG: hypothetical protein MJA29_09835, partial [Candidatus Omnitrophica bacterium]|nr:hypothetical protein [Candidatus Omnitrophota bacterium]
LKEALDVISTYANFWKLKINYGKSVYSIFTRSPKTAKRNLRMTLGGHILEKEENPVYLGVTLDPHLSLKNYMENLKSKASKRLSLLKRLSSTSWGADKRTLRQLYTGYVRSIMDYGLSLQSIASQQLRSSLDGVQNQALRFICGGLRSSPTAACEIDSSLEPMDLRRERERESNLGDSRKIQEVRRRPPKPKTCRPVER